MSKPTRKEDAAQSAVRVGRQSIAKHEKSLPADLESAWEAWNVGIQKVDARGRLLLRAAFEAGYEAGKRARN